MAHSFSSSALMSVASAPVTDEPCSLGCWFNTADTSTAMAMLSVGAATARVQLDVSGGVVRAATVDAGGSSGIASSSASYSASTWTHGLAVLAAANSRTAYLNGANAGTNTTSVTSSGWDRTRVACRVSGGSNGAFFTGLLAELAIWNVALSADDASMLGAGYSPLCVRPDALVFYLPLLGEDSPAPDEVGGLALTVSGGSHADHPPIIYPASIFQTVQGAAAPPAGAAVGRNLIYGSKLHRPCLVG